MTLLQSRYDTLKKGDSAPNFTLKNIDEKRYSLSDFLGKALVIIFMCNHCPYVIPKMKEIAKLQNAYKDKNVIMLCINANDPTDYPEDDFLHMKKVAEKFGYEYYLMDETQDIARAYGATCTPDPFVFNKEHKLVYHGRINNAMEPSDIPTKHDLKEVLDLMLDNKEIKNWFIASQGCSIKWKS